MNVFTAFLKTTVRKISEVVAVHQDDRGDPKSSIAAFRQLVDFENIKFIIGLTWSNLGIPFTKLAETRKIMMISPSLGVAEFNESSKREDRSTSETLETLEKYNIYRSVSRSLNK